MTSNSSPLQWRQLDAFLFALGHSPNRLDGLENVKDLVTQNNAVPTGTFHTPASVRRQASARSLVSRESDTRERADQADFLFCPELCFMLTTPLSQVKCCRS
jgi:hypothetical protein